jgi:flagellar motor switch/type III secretory pathway protein FliN
MIKLQLHQSKISGISHDLAEKWQIFELLSPIGVHSTKPICQQVLPTTGWWIYLSTPWNTPCFISPCNISLQPDSEIYTSTNLSVSFDICSAISAKIINLGLWSPPVGMTYYECLVHTKSYPNLTKIIISMPALSCTEHNRHMENIRNKQLFTTKLKLLLSLPLSMENQKYSVSGPAQLKGNNSSVLKGHLKLTNQQFLFEAIKMEETMDLKLEQEIVSAEFALGEVSISLGDYLALSPGDTLRLPGASVPLKGVLRVGGLPVGSGSLSFKEGELVVTLDNFQEKFDLPGNFLADSTISLREERI